MPKPERHVFVCVQNRPAGHPRGSCGARGCGEVYEEFMIQQQMRNLFPRVMVTNAGCLGPCNMGPNVLVYPEGIMYGNVTKDDVLEIITEHLEGGRPVERLFMHPEIWG